MTMLTTPLVTVTRCEFDLPHSVFKLSLLMTLMSADRNFTPLLDTSPENVERELAIRPTYIIHQLGLLDD